MKKNLIVLTIVCIISSMLTLVGCGSSNTGSSEVSASGKDEAMTIKLAHTVNEKDGFHIAAEKFKEIVEEKTDGNITIELYPNAVLGDERTLLEGMQMGTVDMGIITNGPISNFVEEIAVFELPFMFESLEQAYEVLDGPIGKELLAKLEQINIKGLAYAERGFRNITNSKKEIKGPEDIKDLKIRVMENPVYIDSFKELGANTVPMAWTEALTALQQGTIDGQENPINVIHSYKLYENQKYLTMTKHTYAPASFLMGLSKFNSLSEEYQTIIANAAQEAAEFERIQNAKNEAEQIKELEANGMEIVYPDIAKFKEVVQPVYDKYSDKYGKYVSQIKEQLK